MPGYQNPYYAYQQEQRRQQMLQAMMAQQAQAQGGGQTSRGGGGPIAGALGGGAGEAVREMVSSLFTPSTVASEAANMAFNAPAMTAVSNSMMGEAAMANPVSQMMWNAGANPGMMSGDAMSMFGADAAGSSAASSAGIIPTIGPIMPIAAPIIASQVMPKIMDMYGRQHYRDMSPDEIRSLDFQGYRRPDAGRGTAARNLQDLAPGMEGMSDEQYKRFIDSAINNGAFRPRTSEGSVNPDAFRGRSDVRLMSDPTRGMDIYAGGGGQLTRTGQALDSWLTANGRQSIGGKGAMKGLGSFSKGGNQVEGMTAADWQNAFKSNPRLTGGNGAQRASEIDGFMKALSDSGYTPGSGGGMGAPAGATVANAMTTMGAGPMIPMSRGGMTPMARGESPASMGQSAAMMIPRRSSTSSPGVSKTGQRLVYNRK